jgi:hypothetical protein
MAVEKSQRHGDDFPHRLSPDIRLHPERCQMRRPQCREIDNNNPASALTADKTIETGTSTFLLPA